jgi:hypothetical protein
MLYSSGALLQGGPLLAHYQWRTSISGVPLLIFELDYIWVWGLGQGRAHATRRYALPGVRPHRLHLQHPPRGGLQG